VFGQSEVFLSDCWMRSAIPLTFCYEGDGDVGSVPFYFIKQPFWLTFVQTTAQIGPLLI
jgi:hypothetical protein